MIGFVLARFSYIKVSKDNVAPGQWYWYHRDFYKIGLTLHLAAILPAGFLCVFQFIPKIRHAYLMAHRINGYIIYLLLIVGVFGAAMLTRRTLGGSFGAQLCNSCLTIMTLTSAGLAYYNIRRLRIITDRILNFALSDILFRYLKYGAYFTVWDCQELKFTLDQYGLPEQYLAALYPSCLPPANGTTPEEIALLAMSHTGYVAVRAAMGGMSGPEMIGSTYRWTFSGCLWWGLWIHAIGVELYIRLTPGEDNRLRQYSYERQLKAGNTRYPGNAGTTRDRLGDSGDSPFEFNFN
ncbi:hypothetical protein EV426DRAFT_631166 [Tirmania nivea]|nr:hypothetical protein EV426DRAFT_631166 [Tirmania nivea]